MTKPDDDTFCGVPKNIAVAMVWDWSGGQLEFRFPHATNEQAMKLALSDWLEADERNPYRLAQWMQRAEATLRREVP